MTEDGGGRDGTNMQPRGPAPTLPGILQYVAGVAPANGSASPTSPPQPMDPERQQFLMAAIENLTTDHTKRLRELMDVLNRAEDGDENPVEEKEEALEELIDWCNDIDFGSDFFKMGGIDFLSRYVESEHSGLRWRILDLMATVVQNNEWAQDEARGKDWLKIFINALEKDSVALVRIKALYAISCIVREHPTNTNDFLQKHDGFSVLLRANQSEVEKLQIKSMFLMTSIISADSSHCEQLWRMGIVEQLIGLAYQHVHDAHGANFLTEHVFSALLCFAAHNHNCLEECRRKDLPLKSTLVQRLGIIQKDEQFEEEQNYVEQLLSLLSDPHDNGINDNTNCDTER